MLDVLTAENQQLRSNGDLPPADRTKEMVERCCGSWVGEQSTEDIIANINKSKMSKSEPVKFG